MLVYQSRHSTIPTPHFTLYTFPFLLNSPLFLLYTSHSTLCTRPHSTLQSLYWYGNRGKRTTLFEIICFAKVFTWRDCIRVCWLVLFFSLQTYVWKFEIWFMSVEPHQWTNSSNLGPLINSMYSIVEFYFVLGAPPKHLVDVNKGKQYSLVQPMNCGVPHYQLIQEILLQSTNDSSVIYSKPLFCRYHQ